ncbi:two-component sensor histidine kinase [Actinoplanes sp. LDG1-06]|uniref:histidine kinase n=1 Tax=Paractinoplanes ovalisporus TaxID=2810368 RepID=A0ABS2A7D5_9ACTN|nr:histidine kinase [Actinoplanes ovalisporus]MBM2615736.1 two-component sensor histidine kinase [Actinoplanes ovalisporus]
METIGKPAMLGLWTVVAGRDIPYASRRSWLTGVFVLLGLGTALLVHDHLAGMPAPVKLALAAGAGLPVALLPRHVLAAWRIAMVATLLNLPVEIAPGGLDWPWHPLQPVLLPALVLLIALRHQTRAVIWAALLTTATMAGHLPSHHLPASLAAVAVVAVIGDQVRRRLEAQHSLAAERKLTEAEQERSAVLEERARIAREMHDVVAHHMSMIAVRAETAPYRLNDDRSARDSEFVAIAGASRAALQDMRRLLGVLRSDSPDASLAPSPGLTDVPALVHTAADAGLDVTLRWPPEVTATPLVGQTAYRIIQEALSNATRHASGAPVRIEATADTRTLTITVHNKASTHPTPTPGGGHGLTGMNERVAAVGGTLRAGPTPYGSF